MPEGRSEIAFRHMLDHAEEVATLARGLSPERLEENRILTLAPTRLIEIVGEATGRVPAEERHRHPGVPWPQIVSMRNRLVHGCDSGDYAVLWSTIQEDLPPLIDEMRRILSSQD